MIFDEEVQDSAFVSAQSYFCAVASKGGVDVVIGESTSNESVEDQNLQVGTLLEDEAGWKSLNNTPTFADGTLTLPSAPAGTAWSVAAYGKESYSNKIYRFSYQHTLINDANGEGYAGFFLDLDGTCGPNYDFQGNSIYARIGATGSNSLSFFVGQNAVIPNKKINFSFENGKTYDIAFGVMDVSATAVRVILMIDGQMLIDVEVEAAAYVGASGYFCTTVSKKNATVVIGPS